MHETLQAHLQRRPFRPFEICLSNGNSYTIKHPEVAVLLKTKLIFGLPNGSHVVTCFLLHIAEVKTAADAS